MKRFYSRAQAAETQDGWIVTLDDRPVRTPAKRLLRLPTRSLADAVATEWAGQGDPVVPAMMRLNRLATTAVDLMPERRSGAIEQVAAFTGTDLLCYRAAGPADLVALQARHWDPPLAWLARTHGVQLGTFEGLMPQAQDTATVRAATRVVAGLDDWQLVGLHAVTTATGSLVLGLMVTAGSLAPSDAGDAALVDEGYARCLWGDEEEALAREARLRDDVHAADRFLRALAI